MSVTLSDVGHAFPGGPFLFRHVSTVARSGCVTGLVGPSGSGKSTLLGIIARWTTPTEGTVTSDRDGRTSWVFQNPYGVARRTVLDHVSQPRLGQHLRRRDADHDARSLLAAFALDHRQNAQFRELSGGEGQRLMLARAVATDPGIILVDEPTAQLDQSSARSVIEVLSSLADAGRVVIIATHDSRVRDTCDEVIDLGAVASVQERADRAGR